MLPQSWLVFSRHAEVSVKYANLSLPASGGSYPEKWGAEPFPSQRGAFSMALQKWLRHDVSSIWPDVDALGDPGASKGVLAGGAQCKCACCSAVSA